MTKAGMCISDVSGLLRPGVGTGFATMERTIGDVSDDGIAPGLTVLCEDAGGEPSEGRFPKGVPDGAGPRWSALSATQFVQLMRRRQAGLARGFDRMLALDDLDLHLYDHQRHAVLRVLRDMRGRALLADDVGLGKTVEAGVISKEYIVRGLARRLLVLTPASLTTQWQSELRHKLDLPCHVFSPGDRWDEHDFLIASLDTARRPEHAAALRAMEWDIVIVDEAHRLKNRRTQGWKLVDGLQKKYLLLLTATPIQNDLEELYNMMTLLQPGLLQTYREFKRQFVADRREAKQAEQLRKRIGQAIVRSTRHSAGLHLPRRIVRAVSVPLSEEERAFYDRVLAFARAAFSKPPVGTRPNPLPFILLLRQLCSSPEAVQRTLRALARSDALSSGSQHRAAELAAAAETLCGRSSKLTALARWLRSATEPAIVFTQFRATQQALAMQLVRLGVPVVLFHGAMDGAEKQSALDQFRRRGGVLVSTEAGSEGQNLQFCRVVINCDLPWNPMRVEQRIGRVHRLGQDKDVIIVNVLAPDTMEMHVFRLLQQKIKLFEQVIGDLDVILARDDDDGLLPGAAFERELGTVFLQAMDEDEAQCRLERLGREAAQKAARLDVVRRLNDRTLPTDPVTDEETARRVRHDGTPPTDGLVVASRFLHPLCLDVQFAEGALAPPEGKVDHPGVGKMRERLKEIRFFGARTRPFRRRVVHHVLWLFFFRVAYRTDETRETLHAVAVDPVTETARFVPLPEQFVDVALTVGGAAAGSVSAAGAGTSPEGPEASYVARRLYAEALRFLRDHVENDEGLELVVEARARLARDKARLAQFYVGLEEEALMPLVQQLRRAQVAMTRGQWRRFVVSDGTPTGREPHDVEQVHRRADEATARLWAEYRRRLAELAVKYSVRAHVDLVGVARMTAPRVELTYKMLTPMRREVVFYYDPLQNSVVGLECDRCDTPALALTAASDGDLLCPDCRGSN